MIFDLKRLPNAKAWLEMLQTGADLNARFLEFAELRERVQEANLSANLQRTMRARKPARLGIAAVAQRCGQNQSDKPTLSNASRHLVEIGDEG